MENWVEIDKRKHPLDYIEIPLSYTYNDIIARPKGLKKSEIIKPKGNCVLSFYFETVFTRSPSNENQGFEIIIFREIKV